MIKCENLCLSFSGQVIFDKLNLNIKRGENICISGASGKGKSTLLNLFQGYIQPDKGNVRINGQTLDVTNIKHIRENIISIPQNIHLPVKNGIELLTLLNITPNLPEVKMYMQKLGLEPELISKDFAKISGGQKQRLIISICLSQKKEIILMDEPTSSLDDDSIELLIKTIADLEGKTVVSASHNQLWANSTGKIIEL
jgi:polar amino acid transport system ATP-binding protein/putative ABC transport system ATP-binding protein